MQEIWQEVGENKAMPLELWFECSLYEASDLLLGDHLSEKSDTVKWLDVSMPHKGIRRSKDHKQLQSRN